MTYFFILDITSFNLTNYATSGHFCLKKLEKLNQIYVLCVTIS